MPECRAVCSLLETKLGILNDYEDCDQAFASRTIADKPNDELLRFLSGLSNLGNANTGTQHRDVIRGLAINSIILQRHIERLNAKNAVTTYAVIALTIAAVIGTGLQTWYGYKADRRSEAEAKAIAVARQTPAPLAATPYAGGSSSASPSNPGSAAGR